jgi:hypothetical protein
VRLLIRELFSKSTARSRSATDNPRRVKASLLLGRPRYRALQGVLAGAEAPQVRPIGKVVEWMVSRSRFGKTIPRRATTRFLASV